MQSVNVPPTSIQNRQAFGATNKVGVLGEVRSRGQPRRRDHPPPLR